MQGIIEGVQGNTEVSKQAKTLGVTMISQNQIEEVKRRLVRVYQPLEIYIFGSYAWGKPNEDSDLDLLIVVNSYKKEDRHSLLVDGHKELYSLEISKDLVLYSKEEFDEYSEDQNRLCYKVKHYGKKIYEACA
jgi:predicted nucleotidyltransferase